MTETTNNQEETKAAVVFYDDGCGACDRTIGRWRRRLEPRGIRFLGLSDPAVVRELAASGPLPEDRMPIRDREGRIRWGFDAILWMIQETPGIRFLGRTLALRWIRPFAERTYLWLARHRRDISRACGLEPRTRAPHRHHAATTFLEEP